jgi:hypothetical protein
MVFISRGDGGFAEMMEGYLSFILILGLIKGSQ